MQLTVIGKYGPYAVEKGATSCYLVEEKSTKLVLDFGSGALAKLTDIIKPEAIDAIFISHLHFDHTSDLLTLRYYLEAKGKKMTVYTAYEDSDWYKILFDNSVFNVINIDRNSEITLKDLKLKFFDTVHAAPNLGIRIESEKVLTYTGDTVYYNRIADDLSGSDTILIDAMKPDDFMGSHMKLKEAVCLSQIIKSRFIITHFCDYTTSDRYDNISYAEELTKYEV